MNATWYAIHNFRLLWLIPALALLLGWAEYRRRRQLARFADPRLLARLANGLSLPRRIARAALTLAALAALILGLCRPAWDTIQQDVRRHGRDVVFLLDVSRSMLADDLKPNRLERAKIAIDDCLETLQGDRVALVAFAGTAVTKCPLTLDYGFFRMALAEAGPDTVSRGGTLLGDAMRKVTREVFDRQQREFKDIVLITDGEDHESFPVEAARVAGEEGIRLLAIGLGDESAGTPIVVADERGRESILRYNGKIVRSKLDAATLRQMAEATPGGRYLPVGTGNFDLGEIYSDLIASAEKRELDVETVPRLDEKFQLFLGLALLLLAAAALVGERRPPAATALVLAMILAAAPGAQADESLSPRANFNLGVDAYRQKDFEAAKNHFEAARQHNPRRGFDGRCHLAMGNAAYRLALQEGAGLQDAIRLMEEARDHYAQAADLLPGSETAAANRRVADLALKRLLRQQQEQQQQQAENTQQGQQQQGQQQQGQQQQGQQQQGQQQQGQQQQGQQQQQGENERNADKLRELANRQQEAAEQTEREQSEAQSPEDIRSSSKAAQAQQQELREKTEELSKDIRQSSNAEEASRQMAEALRQQDQASESLRQNDLGDAADHQRQAAEALRQAADELGAREKGGEQRQDDDVPEDGGEPQKENQGNDGEPQEPAGDPPSAEGDGEDEPSSRDETDAQETAARLSDDARDILEEERKNQRLRRRQSGRMAEVDKDW